MKLVFKIFASLVLALIAIVLFQTLNFENPESYSPATAKKVTAYPKVLAEALRFETISHKPGMIDDSTFLKFHDFLKESFPLVHSKLKLEKINKYSLMYYWKGSNSTLDPLVIMAHQDVVPADYSTLSQWHYPPFAGNIVDGFIYGRGSLDDKGSMISILNAAEELLAENFQPSKTIIFCFGHDEEIGGDNGAKEMAKILEKRGIKAFMVLDEGGNIVKGIVPGIESPVALIGTSEKGYVSLEFTVETAGGHSSMPNKKTAIAVLTDALYHLKENPMPNRISDPLKGFISSIGPELPFVQKMAFANTWLFRPIIFDVYEESASGTALIRTTQTTTIFQSGIKDNVIPNRAKAVVNFRLLPGDEPEEILRRAREIVSDSLVKIKIFESFSIPASPISEYKTQEFRSLGNTIKGVFPNVIVSPYLVIGATDARYFYSISDCVYRFSPIVLEKEDLPRLHGINERISVDGFENSVNFYATLLFNLNEKFKNR